VSSVLLLAMALVAVISGVSAYQLAGARTPLPVAATHACRAWPLMQMEPDQPLIVAEETYGLMLKTLLESENDLSHEISANYNMVDYAFLERLEESTASEDAKIAARAAEIKSVVNTEMAKRMQEAAQTLKSIFASPTPVVMDGKIAGLVRQGKIDTALYDLLQANLEQAQAAGEQGKGAATVLQKLKDRVRDELDQKLPPPVALLRRLLRMESSEARQRLLKEKMSPKQVSKIMLIDSAGKEEADDDPTPDVPPKDVVESIKELKLRFGNVDENYDTGFVQKLDVISDEAEAIALELAGGKELTASQAQDMAWERGTVSVFQLEAVEEEAHQDGNFAVWESEAQQQMAKQDEAARKQSIERDMGR